MARMVRIYFSKRPFPNLGTYEIFKDGKPTGEIVRNSLIRKILDQQQYQLFIAGEEIFMIPADRFRTRHHKKKPNKRKINPNSKNS